MFFKIGVLKNSAIFTGKHLCCSLFFDKVAGLRPGTLIKKRLQHRCFLWILQNFKEQLIYRTPPVAASEPWRKVQIQFFAYKFSFFQPALISKINFPSLIGNVGKILFKITETALSAYATAIS